MWSFQDYKTRDYFLGFLIYAKIEIQKVDENLEEKK